MKKWLFFSVLISFFYSFSQVGINTTNPSNASVLHIASSSDGLNFGGFLPPKVTIAERDAILAGAGDDGLVVFVAEGNDRCLQIYNEGRTRWENIYCFSAVAPTSEIIAGWDTNGLTNFGPSPFAATTTIPEIAVGGLTRGSGVETSVTPANHAWGGHGWNEGSDLPTAIANNNFATFTIMPNTGNTLSLISIEPYNIRRSTTGPTTGQWQYRINAGPYTNIGAAITWGSITTAAGNPQAAIDLSSIAELQNLLPTQTVTFRIVNWDSPSADGTWYINDFQSGDDLIIIGNVSP